VARTGYRQADRIGRRRDRGYWDRPAILCLTHAKVLLMPVEASMLQTLSGTPLVFLTTIGRQTGQPRTVELWFVYDQGVIYLLGHAASHWVRNLGIDPRVTLEIADTSFAGTAQFVDDKRAMTYRLFEKKYGAQQVSYWYRGQGADRRTVAVTPVLTSH
jgi:deazaflavin-dependent oxidoreductase (nitroreductase family)